MIAEKGCEENSECSDRRRWQITEEEEITPEMSNEKQEQPKNTTTIVINGRQKTVTAKELTFEQIVALAFDTQPNGENVEITVTYTRGHGDKPEGSLTNGRTVKVKEGMIFNVSATNRS
jgi:hypothetical protein